MTPEEQQLGLAKAQEQQDQRLDAIESAHKRVNIRLDELEAREQAVNKRQEKIETSSSLANNQMDHFGRQLDRMEKLTTALQAEQETLRQAIEDDRERLKIAQMAEIGAGSAVADDRGGGGSIS